MKAGAAVPYRCPYTQQPLTLEATEVVDGDVVSGTLRTADGFVYKIEGGVALLIDFDRESLAPPALKELAFYEAEAKSYDGTMEWVFGSFYEDEDRVREAMLDLLRVPRGGTVLETGCGTGRDSIRIARRIGSGGCLYVQDLSPGMLGIGKAKVDALRRAGGIGCEVEYFTGNAETLPFADGTLDAAFHFGGINIFSDQGKAVAEMARVVKKGGRVVFGDEGLAPWLRETEYGKILMRSSPLYEHAPPLDAVPAPARDVSVHWIIGNAYYLIAFTVGEGELPLDLDLPIVGRRGGTHRTRYYGALEGVTPQTKDLVLEAAAREGISIHEWLERTLSESLRKR